MSIQIDGLSGSVSLLESIEMIYPPVGYTNVSNFEKIRISIYASTIVKVQLEWSYDGNRAGPINMYRCGSNLWKCDFIEVLMPYLRIHIINESGRPCEDLIVHTWTPSLKFEMEEIKVNGVNEVEKPKERSKTPLARFFPGKPPSLPAVSSRDRVSNRDDRLPDFIPQGAILIGGDKGRINVIPKGNVGEYLMMGELGPTYKLPYPPTQLSESSKDKLNSQFW